MAHIREAFAAIPRENFLPPEERANAGWDMPLPIGYGQTNSQPTTVRMMLEWLDARPGQKVLDVGSGSAWTSGLLSHIVGKKGKVIAVEKVPELVEFGRKNCEHMRLKNVEVYQARGVYGKPDASPYDRILVSASAMHVPTELLDQLKEGGRMVIPVRDTMHVIQKDAKGNVSQEEYPGFAFVPLV